MKGRLFHGAEACARKKASRYRARLRDMLRDMGEFADKVFEIVRQVPCGKVTTYGQVARLMGRPRSARYVGFALRGNPSPSAEGGAIPCHRVLFRDGSLCSGFAFGGPGVQRDLLLAEGVTFVDDEHVDLAAHMWDGALGRDGAAGGEPLGPPADFDWERELGDE